MKLLVLAHTPPPFHGQSYMVRILLDVLKQQGHPDKTAPVQSSEAAPGVTSDNPVIGYAHIDFRLSNSIEDIGHRPWRKLPLLLQFCLRVVWTRFREGSDTLFYIPAPALRNALVRDWLVMLCCRPFFKHLVFWWQAAGLGTWLEHTAKPWERWITHRLLGQPNLSVVMGAETAHDAQFLRSRRIAIVPNAIPDPCPEDAAQLVSEKAARRSTTAQLLARQTDPLSAQKVAPWPWTFRVLYIGLCFREKGLFDAVEAVAQANRRLAEQDMPVRVQLEVAGRFYLPAEQQEFEERIRQPDLQWTAPPSATGGSPGMGTSECAVRYHGFVEGTAKARLFRETDCLVFPTYYAAESFGLVLIEAMAHGSDVITTRWSNIPELLPPDYPGLVQPRDPQALAECILGFLQQYEGGQLRRHYEDHHSIDRFWSGMGSALREL